MKLTCKTLKSDLQLYRILLKFFKILGLAPFNMNLTPTQNKADKFDINYTYSFEESAYDFILSVCLFFKILYDFLHQDFEVPHRHFHHLTNNFNLMIIYLSYCLKQQSAAKIITNLTYLEVELTSKSWDYSLKLTPVKKYYLVLNIFFGVNFIGVVIFHGLTSANQTIETYVRMIFLFITGVCMIQYASVIIYLYQRLKTLNSAVLTLIYSKRDSNDENYLSFWTSSFRNNITNRKLTFLRQAHRLLYDLLCDVAKFFSVPILFALSMFFPVLLLAVQSLVSKKLFANDFFKTTLRHFNSTLLISLTFLPIYLLCSFVTKIIKEMKLTRDNLNKVMISCSNGGLFKDELEKFFIELLHRNYNITASGFFKIDNSLLTLIITGICIYCFSVNIYKHQVYQEDSEGLLLNSFV